MILVYLELYFFMINSKWSLKIKGCIKLREGHDRFAPSLAPPLTYILWSDPVGLAGLNTPALPNRVRGCPWSLRVWG